MSKDQLYFIKQKLIGAFGLLLAALTVKLLNGDATVAILLIIPSLLLIFTKKMYIYDSYYVDMMEEKENKGL